MNEGGQDRGGMSGHIEDLKRRIAELESRANEARLSEKIYLETRSLLGRTLDERNAELAATNELLRREIQEKNSLQRLTLRLAGPLSLREVGKTVAEESRRLFGYDAFAIWLLNDTGKTFGVIYSEDTPLGADRPMEEPAEDISVEELKESPLLEGRPRIINRPEELSPVTLTPFGETGRLSRSLMFSPIFQKNQTIGVITIQSYKAGQYGEKDLELLMVFVEQMAGAFERIRMEQALKESDLLFREIFSRSPDAICVTSIEGRILDANPTACQMFQRLRELLLNMNISHLTAEPLRDKIRGEISLTASGKKDYFECCFLKGSGIEIPVDVRAAEIEFKGKPARLLQIRDISERIDAEEKRKMLETRTQQARRMESLAMMAGGVAHDFNNLLTSILGYVDVALTMVPMDDNVRYYFREIEKMGQKAATLSSQILFFSGQGKYSFEPLNLSQIAEEALPLAKTAGKKGVNLTCLTDPGIPSMDADPSRIRQAVMSLILNAMEVCAATGGNIHVTTGMMDPTREYLADTYVDDHLPSGNYVFIEVSDTGPEMDQETRKRLFDPFFRNNPRGKGLGMAVVLGITRMHRGAIKVESGPGRGSRIRMLFPALQTAAGPQCKGVGHGAPCWKGRGTVLLADGDEAIRQAGKLQLIQLGFRVVTAADGQEALNLASQHGRMICLIMLDIMLPRLEVPVFIRQIQETGLAVPVIVTGISEPEEIKQHLKEAGTAGILRKPFQTNALKELLRLVLEDEKAGAYEYSE
ncbi:MAG TPA: PAS domain S-box protein [Candidatus Sumerlaeota bacterium]|nr:PAS domain S-box protein [Candidatus Sumerlaeota bacterium]